MPTCCCSSASSTGCHGARSSSHRYIGRGVTPSAGRRFRIAHTPRVLGGGLLAERHHERTVAVVVGAHPLLNHWLREAEGLGADRRPIASRASTTVLRPANRTSTDPGSTSPGALMCRRTASGVRSEEHTSELQSPYDLVCR